MNNHQETEQPIEISLPTLSGGAFWVNGTIFDGDGTAISPPEIYIEREDVPEGVEITGSEPMESTAIFSHRLNQYSPKNPEIQELNDCVQLAVSRADACLMTLQSQFVKDAARLNDEALFYTIDAISLEIQDVGKIVSDFTESQKKPPAKS